MTSQQIIDIVQPSKVLSSEQLMKIMSFKHSKALKEPNPLERPRTDGLYRFMASNDPGQITVIDDGLSVKKTKDGQGTVVMSQRQLPERCSVQLRIDHGCDITQESDYLGIGIAEGSMLNLNPFFAHQIEEGGYICYLNYKH